MNLKFTITFEKLVSLYNPVTKYLVINDSLKIYTASLKFAAEEVKKRLSDKWKGLHPKYKYKFYDDNDIIQFIKKYFPKYIGVINYLHNGSELADIFRYMVLLFLDLCELYC